jgi:hypothetical protein
MFFKKIILEEGVVNVCCRLLEVGTVQQVVEQTVVLLGTIAAYNPECRDYVLKVGALPPMLRLVRQVQQAPLVCPHFVVCLVWLPRALPHLRPSACVELTLVFRIHLFHF